MAAALHDLSFKFKGFVEHFILPQHVDKVKERALRRLLMFTVSTFAEGVSWVIHRSLKRDSWLVIGFTDISGNEPFSTFIGSSALT